MKLFRKNRKKIAAFLLTVIVTQIIEPSVSFALTGGPSQPEVQSFEPVATTQMVDPFTGDFSYNIPLMDVGGYPINLSYHAGPTMDEEASWVGLGWNINPGVINRNVRGIPDDFNGEKIKKEYKIRDNNTYGLNAGVTLELFGFDAGSIGAELGLGLNYNNYKGLGYEAFASPSLSIGKNSGPGLNANLGISASSEGGISLNPSLSLSLRGQENMSTCWGLNASFGLSYNSLQGLKSMNYGLGPSAHKRYKKDLERMAGSNVISSTISFATPTYTPYTDMPMSNFGFSFRATVGGSAFGVHPGVFLGGYFSGQSVSNEGEDVSAYGYLYAHNAKSSKAIHDFNREKDGAFSKITPGLPLASHTYDVYAVSGQGISGSYRPYRSDIGIVYDSEVNSGGHDLSGLDFGVELGGGGFAHLGVNATTTWTESHTGMWKENDYAGIFGFGVKEDGLYEPAYFKRAGELLEGIDSERFDKLGKFDAVRPVIDDNSQRLQKILKTDKDETIDLEGFDNKRTERAKRSQHISLMNVKESAAHGLLGKARSYPYNDFSMSSFDEVEVPADVKETQTSELVVVKEDGARYVYGIPAFNTSQQEVMFATNETEKGNGLVDYKENENTLQNESGIDHFFSKTTTPAYAHSYLLSAVLSPDYEDLDLIEGPSEGDKGDYVLFHYTKAIADYQWRVPYDTREANFNYGVKSDNEDNKASYIYGTKDIWYVHSVESRNYIAEFELENREDGKEVAGVDGGAGERPLQRLKQIRLFSKGEKRNSAQASPLKVVHFEYDYSRCQGIRNSSNVDQNDNVGEGGKLTLRSVYFTYQNSYKGRLTPYKFNYSTINPSYDPKGSDRWNVYKPDNSSGLPNAEYPYTDQLNPESQKYASAWSLSEIQLPSGGIMKIEYESDDYAYVQDKRAMEMIKVTGAGSSSSSASTGGLLFEDNSSATHVNDYLYFDIHKPIEGVDVAAANQILSDQYFRNHEGRDLKETDQWLHFRFLVNLDKDPDAGKEEYIQGYMQVADYGVIGTTAPFTKGFIRIRKVPAEGNTGSLNAHPVSKTAWQFTRRNNLKIVTEHNHDFPDFGLKDLTDPAEAVPKFLGDIFKLSGFFLSDEFVRFLTGFNNYLMDNEFAKEFVPQKSWVRLYTPFHKKLGGGHRVKKIVLNDQWKSIAGDRANYKDSEYGQMFDYTIDDELGKGISSGVASYEPIIGGEENPHRQPVFFTDEIALGPDNQYMQEEPYGESFYPSPVVGYRKVVVTSLKKSEFKKHSTGKTIHEFYTAKDFPIPKTRTTGCDKPELPWNFNRILVERIFGVEAKHHLGASQGYVVELNDMHGKPKARWEYDANDGLIAGQEFKYKTANGSLDNVVKVLSKEHGNLVKEITVGVEADMVIDMRESQTDTRNYGAGGNIDVIPALFIPIPIPTIWPQYSHENTRLRTASFTKVIHRYGVLEEVIGYDQSSRVSVVNEAYDAETGQVLLTRSANNFEDPIYTFNYPAHWVYDGMGSIYKNQSFTTDLSINGSGVASVTNASLYFHPGDVLIIEENDALLKLWVTEVSTNTITILDKYGDVHSTSGSVPAKVWRSGRRNLLGTNIGTVETMTNPISGNTLNFVDVLNTTAAEFSDEWPTLCNCGTDKFGSLAQENLIIYENPFVSGKRGDWRLKTSLSYLDKRKITSENGNTNVRKDGIFENSYVPFWKAPEAAGRSWERQSSFSKQRWDTVTVINAYNPLGFQLENEDALGIPSASLYGYGQSLPIGISSNARYRDIGFDNFEDYDFKVCFDDHFSFSQSSRSSITSEHSHTGRKSIYIAPNSSRTMKKKIN